MLDAIHDELLALVTCIFNFHFLSIENCVYGILYLLLWVLRASPSRALAKCFVNWRAPRSAALHAGECTVHEESRNLYIDGRGPS
jgi:hypothetical protein